MSCRSTPHGSAYTTIARLRSGLTDVQTLSLFHSLRREFADNAPPASDERWHQYLDATAESVEADQSLSEARRRSILSRLVRSRENTPDDASFAAIVVMDGRAASQAGAVTQQLQEISSITGETTEEVRARFQTYADEVDHARGASAPANYTDAAVATARQRGMPIDRGTVSALARLRDEAQAPTETPNRITRQSMNSQSVAEAGYDPRGGRLEVAFHHNPDHVYMYRNVPPDVWQRMQTGSAGQTFTRSIRGNRLYQYTSRSEAEAAGLASRCSSCGQFSTVGHTCPAPQTNGQHDPTRTTNGLESEAVWTGEGDGAIDENVEHPDAAIHAAVSAALQREAQAPAAEPTPEPEPEPEELPARPVVVLNRGWGGRQRLSGSAVTRIPQAETYDHWRAPTQADIRRVAVDSEARFAFTWAGHRGAHTEDYRARRVADENTFGPGRFQVNGTANVRRDGREMTVTTQDLRCDCAEYRENYDCPHVRAATNAVRVAATPAPRGGASAPVDPAAAQAAAELAAARDWTRQDAGIAEAQQSWAQQDDALNYSTNFQAFENDIKTAEERVAAGQPAMEYQTENAMGGWCPEGGDEGFGVEMEFVLPTQNRQAALNAIGQELYDAGLTPAPRQARYHSDSRTYHSHDRGWKFEQDCTVDGEVISPVMKDTPETWANVAKVCEIVKRHGGKASAKTGSHVHVSAPSMSGGQAAQLLHSVNQHEDVIYRMSMNPEATKHRNMTWCGPNREIADGTTDLSEVRRASFGHHSGLNLQHVSGSASDHPEIRHWDGTLDPAVIQAQAKISVGLVKAAGRNANQPSRRGKEPVGSHHQRLAAIRGRSRRKLTSDELREDSATARSFIDTLFSRPQDKAQMAALFSVTKWTPRG